MTTKEWRYFEASEPGLLRMGAVRWDRLVFVSGQLARGNDGALVGEGDIHGQTRQCFDNVARVLSEVGGGLDDVVKLTCFIANREDFPGYYDVKRSIYPEAGPATTAIIVDSLALDGCLIEIDAIAVLP